MIGASLFWLLMSYSCQVTCFATEVRLLITYFGAIQDQYALPELGHTVCTAFSYDAALCNIVLNLAACVYPQR